MSRRKQPLGKQAPPPKTRLDRSRSFGKVVGSSTARFSQDGNLFDKNDDMLEDIPVEMRTTIEA